MGSADGIDRLYGLPLGEFTPARNKLARRLRKEGRPEEAEEVAALRKPSLAAWVVNQLARDRPQEVAALLKAAADIKAGREGAGERFRESAEALTAGGRDVLEAAGRPATDAVLQQVGTTVRTAAAEDPDRLAAGRLTRDLTASSFAAAFAGTAPRTDTPPPRAPRARPQRNRERIERARRAVDEAREQAARLRREAATAGRAARQARTAADAAERRLAEAERRLAAARDT
jgi:hypothetical protein